MLDAAVNRFGRDGFRGTAVTAIAREAGVGTTVPYLYFPTKEALFFEAADDDVAGVIGEVFATAHIEPADPAWPGTVMAAAIDSLERHPLARRVLAGLEPDAAARVVETAALAEAEKALAASFLEGQRTGAVRTDIAAEELAGGLLLIVLALLAGTVRFGVVGEGRFESVLRVLHASVTPGR